METVPGPGGGAGTGTPGTGADTSVTKRVPTRYRRRARQTADSNAGEKPKLKVATDLQSSSPALHSLNSPGLMSASSSNADYATPGAWSFKSGSPSATSSSGAFFSNSAANRSNVSLGGGGGASMPSPALSEQSDNHSIASSTNFDSTASPPIGSGGSNFANAPSTQHQLSKVEMIDNNEQASSYNNDQNITPRPTTTDLRAKKSTKSLRSRSRSQSRSRRRPADEKDEEDHPTQPPPMPVIDNIVSIDFKLPTQMITKSVRENTVFSDLLQEIVSEHRYELEHQDDVDEYMMWEICERAKIKRPIRPHEFVKFVWQSWEVNTQNYIKIGSSSRRLDMASIASLVPRRDVLNKDNGPSFKGKIYYWRNQSDWRKGWLEISNYHLSLKKRQDGREVRAININEFDLYENMSSRNVPGKFALTIRSQQSPDFFVDKTDSLHYFSTDSQQDYEQLRNIFYSIRSQAMNKICTAHQQQIDDGDTTITTSTDNVETKMNLLQLHHEYDSATNHEEHYTPNMQPQFKQDGLLGLGYQKKHQQAVTKYVQGNTTNAAGAAAVVAAASKAPPGFTPNSLLSKPVPLSNSNPQFDTGRGLMGKAYGSSSSPTSPFNQQKKTLPQHSMAVQHRIHR